MKVKGRFSFILLGYLSMLLLSSSILWLMSTPSVARVGTLDNNYLMPKALASVGEEQAAEEATQEEEEGEGEAPEQEEGEGEGEAPEQEEEEEEEPIPTPEPEVVTGSVSSDTDIDTSLNLALDEQVNALRALEQEGGRDPSGYI